MPAAKVTEVIASTRGITVGEHSISSSRQRDIASIDDFLDTIHRVREVTIEGPAGTRVQADGDFVGTLPMHLQVLPRRLNVLVPDPSNTAAD